MERMRELLDETILDHDAPTPEPEAARQSPSARIFPPRHRLGGSTARVPSEIRAPTIPVGRGGRRRNESATLGVHSEQLKGGHHARIHHRSSCRWRRRVGLFVLGQPAQHRVQGAWRRDQEELACSRGSRLRHDCVPTYERVAQPVRRHRCRLRRSFAHPAARPLRHDAYFPELFGQEPQAAAHRAEIDAQRGLAPP